MERRLFLFVLSLVIPFAADAAEPVENCSHRAAEAAVAVAKVSLNTSTILLRAVEQSDEPVVGFDETYLVRLTSMEHLLKQTYKVRISKNKAYTGCEIRAVLLAQ